MSSPGMARCSYRYRPTASGVMTRSLSQRASATHCWPTIIPKERSARPMAYMTSWQEGA